jgi:hypothetical protein
MHDEKSVMYVYRQLYTTWGREKGREGADKTELRCETREREWKCEYGGQRRGRDGGGKENCAALRHARSAGRRSPRHVRSSSNLAIDS